MSGARRPEPIVAGLGWAASELGISLSTARRLAEAGELPGAFALPSGGRRLWRVSTVEFRRQIEARAAATDRAPTAPRAAGERLAGVEWASVPPGKVRRSQGHTGRQIAASTPRAPLSITGDVPLVRRRRPSSPASAPGESS